MSPPPAGGQQQQQHGDSDKLLSLAEQRMWLKKPRVLYNRSRRTTQAGNVGRKFFKIVVSSKNANGKGRHLQVQPDSQNEIKSSAHWEGWSALLFSGRVLQE